MTDRPNFPAYCMRFAELAATRSTCLRRKVGAVAVRDGHILATGYNGAPTGLPHCDETGCVRQKLGVPSGQRHEVCRGLHAEQNVIIQAALHGVSLYGATLYCTASPCVICAKMLINAGFRAVYYADEYPDNMGVQMMREAGIYLERMENENNKE